MQVIAKVDIHNYEASFKLNFVKVSMCGLACDTEIHKFIFFVITTVQGMFIASFDHLLLICNVLSGSLLVSISNKSVQYQSSYSN